MLPTMTVVFCEDGSVRLDDVEHAEAIREWSKRHNCNLTITLTAFGHAKERYEGVPLMPGAPLDERGCVIMNGGAEEHFEELDHATDTEGDAPS